MGVLSEKEKDILSIQVRILVMLNKICGLTQEEITEIIHKTNLLDVIAKMYFMLNQEGDHANMFHIKEALSVRGIEITVPDISDHKWQLWNMLIEEYG